ncbi:MAG: polysaccharide biosynthesis tyrosine autokinase [Acidobacteria bacterium]|jgi:capsular exopolysaccharide synthesis family protein|nr:polysaccharide biosynthesis tyrosine autokinase [Acidobacteriota bacterium]
MKDTREIIHRQMETVEIERPFEPQIPATNGSYGAYRETGTQDGFQLINYWRIIRKRFWLVVGIAVLVTTLTAIYMARKPDIFQSRAIIQVDLEQANPDLVVTDRRVPMSNQDPSYFNTQLQLLVSESLLRRVVKELSLDSNKEFQKAKSDESVSVWRQMLKAVGLASTDVKKTSNGVDEVSVSASASLASSEEIAEAVRLAPYVNIIKKNLSVEPVRETRTTNKDTRLIEVSFRHTNPELASFIVNGIGEVFSKANQEKRTGTSSKTSDFLQERIATLQSEVKNGEVKLFNLTKDADILKTDEGQTIALDRLSGLNKDLLSAENERKNAEAEYTQVSKNAESLNARAEELTARYTSERENTIRGLVNDTQKKVADLKAQRARLLEEYMPTAPEVKEIDTQIDTLESEVKKAITGNEEDLATFRKQKSAELLNNLRTKYLSAKNKEDQIRASFDQQYNQAQGQNQSAVTLSLLKQDIDTKKGFLKELTAQQSGNDVIARGTGNNISIAEIAIPPEQPVAPRRLMTVVGALFLSTLFGMGLALFLEYLDDTIRTIEEVETYLQLPALAAIPRIDSMPKRRLLLVGGNDDGEMANPTNDLLIHNDSRSSLAEAYRQLRTSILLSTAGHAPKSLLITSSLPSEGKTTTAINTAISLAQTGAKVLIIDADMRRPRLHSVFNISNAEGLSTLLSNELSEQGILDVIGYDEEAKLNLLTSGPVPPNPAELIASEQMSNLLKTLQKNFTHVVVDSPPIASFTDGVLIASMVDGVILVVNSGKSSRQVVRRSRQLLLDIGAKIFGVVLNNVNLRSQDNYYYYQSYYHRDSYRQDEE